MIDYLSRKTKVAGRRYWGAFLGVEALFTIWNFSSTKRAGGELKGLVLKRCHLKANTLYLLSVAAFGFHAGYAGAALALLDWAWQVQHSNKEALPGKDHYQRKSDLDSEVKEHISNALQNNKGKPPRVLVMGALGRCGRGVSTPHVIVNIDANLKSRRLSSAADKLASQRNRF